MKPVLTLYFFTLTQILVAQDFELYSFPPYFLDEQIISSSITFADVDGDGDQDAMVIGKNISGSNLTENSCGGRNITPEHRGPIYLDTGRLDAQRYAHGGSLKSSVGCDRKYRYDSGDQ